MKKTNIKPLAAVMGAALMTLGQASVANAAQNPFASQELSSGYNLAAKECKKDDKECLKKKAKKKAEGKCGEGKCGEGKCGGDDKATEGKCGEGKCGEGKCGGH